MRLNPLATISLALAVAAAAFGADPGAPRRVQVEDDPEDAAGQVLLVSWEAPPEVVALPLLQPVGYQVLYRQARPGAEFREGPVVPLDETSASLGDLKPWPWPKWEVAVAVVYAPQPSVGRAIEAVPWIAAVRPMLRSDPTPPLWPVGIWYAAKYTPTLVWSVLICAIVLLTLHAVRGRAEEVYIRPIAGLEAVNDAIGRATEMGQPMLYVSGLGGVSNISTIASMLILGHLSRRAAAYESDIIVPCNDPLVMATEREIVRQAYTEAGKPDAYRPENIYFLTDSQFGYVAAVDGIMMREQPAANFYMGYFYAEALILAETGNQAGAIQIAGTDADTQLPFFITACDYTLMGEELYAASAYLSRQPLLVAQLRGQDIAKALIAAALFLGVAAATYAAVTTGAAADMAQAFVEWFAQ
ncbi:MAG: DUF6754 domain-containing protein [Armatimonadota bacterium]|nr:DUF6754 domain-containing protein [Armatimonadota bacterium]